MGCVSPRPALKVETATPVATRVDGMGVVVGTRARSIAIEIASAYGLGLVLPSHSNHFG